MSKMPTSVTATVLDGIAQTRRGISAGLRSRAGMLVAIAAAVVAFDLLAPVVVLSLARKPVDFFTFNPWLPRLPGYLLSSESLGTKLSFLSHLTIAWASADSTDGIEWGFILDVPALARIACTSLVFGAYFAMLSYRRQMGACDPGAGTRPAGVLGALTSIFGLTTGPCTLAGCGAPVLPVVGLAFTGLPNSTLVTFATISRISIAVVLALMALAILWFGWRAGAVATPPDVESGQAPAIDSRVSDAG
jgi:hypothetical protein